jgi:hypothetical protein
LCREDSGFSNDCAVWPSAHKGCADNYAANTLYTGWWDTYECCGHAVLYCDGDGDGGVTHSFHKGSDATCHTDCSGVESDESLRPLCQPTQVVGAMEAAPTERDVQFYGSAALSLLAFRSPANQAAIAAAGGIDAVVVAMARYPDDHEVQDECFEAMCYLAEDSPANQAAIAKAGGVELVAAAIEKWQGLANQPTYLDPANQHAFQRCQRIIDGVSAGM